MPDKTAEQPQDKSEDDNMGRLEAMEKRLAEIENASRLNAVEERLADLENSDGESDATDQSSIEGEGQKAMRLALAGFLNHETVVKAVADLTKTLGDSVKDWSGLKTKHLEASLTAYYWGLGFSAFVLLVLSALMWHDKISKELAAALFGSLIGYWYGREKPKGRSEEHTSELQSLRHLVCRLLLE